MSEAFGGEYADIRTAAQAAMRDTCQTGTRGTPTGNDPGAVSWTYATAIPCGLHVTTKGETVDGAQATVTDAVLRLPWGTVINSSNRVKMITQAGDTLSPSPVYAVQGDPYQHISNVQARLVRVTGESVL